MIYYKKSPNPHPKLTKCTKPPQKKETAVYTKYIEQIKRNSYRDKPGAFPERQPASSEGPTLALG